MQMRFISFLATWLHDMVVLPVAIVAIIAIASYMVLTANSQLPWIP